MGFGAGEGGAKWEGCTTPKVLTSLLCIRGVFFSPFPKMSISILCKVVSKSLDRIPLIPLLLTIQVIHSTPAANYKIMYSTRPVIP